MLVWQEDEPANLKGFHFFSAPVSGSANYWSVKVNDLGLAHEDGKTLIGCENNLGGCTAIVDTGTSLLTLDEKTLKNLENYVEKFAEEKMECNAETLHKFPTLTLKIDGNDFNLRPEDYIMYTEVAEAQMPQQFKDTRAFLSQKYPKLAKMFADKMKDQTKQCVLMFTEPIADNVLILGMPTFRNYYVTFDRREQTVNFAKHDGSFRELPRDGQHPAPPAHRRLQAQVLQRIPRACSCEEDPAGQEEEVCIVAAEARHG